MSANFFALDLGEKYIKIADGEKRGASFAVKTFAYDESAINIYESEGDKNLNPLLSSIGKLIADAGIKKKVVAVVIPDSRSYSRIIEMPYLTEKELTSAIKYQADQFIPVPMDQVNLDIEILYSNKKTNKLGVLIIAAPTTIVDKAVYIAESCGLIPTYVENETTASLRFISEIAPIIVKKNTQPQLTMFVNFGFSTTSLYLYDLLLNIPRDIHNFSLGYNIFIKSIKANFNKEEEEVKKILETIGLTDQSPEYNLSKVIASPYNELKIAIEKFVIATKVKFNASINAIYLFGEGYKIAGLAEKLSTSLGIPSQHFNTYSFFNKNNVVDFFKNDLSLFVPSMGANLR